MKAVGFFSVALILAAFSLVQAELVTQTVEYSQDTIDFQSYLVYKSKGNQQRPGVVLVHEWWGLNEFAKKMADSLAREGFVVLAVDMYGEGKTTTDPKQAGEWAGAVRGTELIHTRARLGLDTLAAMTMVDSSRLGAIGFCFGGTSVLQLAFAGAPLHAVASFHGGLPEIDSSDLGDLSSAVLVLHGADDPMVPDSTFEALTQALQAVDADWRVVLYGNAVHSFTNPGSGNDKSRGVAYDKQAAKDSWESMLLFLEQKLER